MKKQQQLGMNPSTASQRLVKDVLYSLVVKTEQNNCYHCGEPMTRETFSIEHKVPWLDSENPLELFFALDNISFSHHSCNVAAGRKPRKHATPEQARLAKRQWDKDNRPYCQERRQAEYSRTGK